MYSILNLYIGEKDGYFFQIVHEVVQNILVLGELNLHLARTLYVRDDDAMATLLCHGSHYAIRRDLLVIANVPLQKLLEVLALQLFFLYRPQNSHFRKN